MSKQQQSDSTAATAPACRYSPLCIWCFRSHSPASALLSRSSHPTSALNDRSDTNNAMAVKDFVLNSRGHTVITRVIIANNGMAAVKAIRSIRKWSYETFGNERLIEFTAMCTPEDLNMNAEYVRMADHYIEVPGGTANNNYSQRAAHY
ncbi:hypothetical protein BASA81_015827 [Batrachochytrium salamandrivorans]|nr:hypothetical protein BASA81_015827 [Batrachochytrium salamandrivorans]